MKHRPIFGALLLLSWLVFAGPARGMETMSQLSDSIAEDRLSALEDIIIETGLARENIPAIDRPVFTSTEDASLANDSKDIVFVAEFGPEDVRIYPQLVLVWHEIVNDVLGEQKISVTYCPLTGSVIGFKGQVGRFETTFGTTGKLVNNNLLMYDRSTNSQWPQIFGFAITGPLRGKELSTFPLLWTTWARAKARYPAARVLSRTTGFRRSYGRDPYGSYTRSGTYYSNHVIAYRLSYFDKRLPPKERILGIKTEGVRAALVRSVAMQQPVLSFDPGEPFVSFYDPALDTVRVFEARHRGRTMQFYFSDNKRYDRETGSEWSVTGRASAGALQGVQLVPAAAFDCMWFAWAAFFPDSDIIDGTVPAE